MRPGSSVSSSMLKSQSKTLAETPSKVAVCVSAAQWQPFYPSFSESTPLATPWPFCGFRPQHTALPPAQIAEISPRGKTDAWMTPDVTLMRWKKTGLRRDLTLSPLSRSLHDCQRLLKHLLRLRLELRKSLGRRGHVQGLAGTVSGAPFLRLLIQALHGVSFLPRPTNLASSLKAGRGCAGQGTVPSPLSSSLPLPPSAPSAG